MAIIRTNDGRLLLAGGRLLLATVGAADAPPTGNSNTLTITLDDFKAADSSSRPVIQRKAGTDSGDVPVLFDFTGDAPQLVQARVVDANTGTIVKDWTALSAVSVTASEGLGTLIGVPIGGDYLLQIRDGNKTTTFSNGSKPWGVGVCILAEGQSNMVGTLDGSVDYANGQAGYDYQNIVPGTPINELAYSQSDALLGSTFGRSGFGGASGSDMGPNGGGVLGLLRILGAALKQKHGRRIPVCVVPWAFNSTSLAAFLPGGNTYEGLFNGVGTTAGAVGFKSPRNYWAGDFETLVLHQGEADEAMTRAARLQQLKNYYQARLDYVAQFGRTAAHLAFLPAVLGSYNYASWDNSPAVAGVEKLRGAVLDLWAYAKANNWPRVRPGWNCIDLVPPPGNPLHFLYEDGRKSAVRLIQAVLHEVVPDLAPSSGLGPRITAVARGSGSTVIVTVTHDGGTQLVGKTGATGITGFTGLKADGSVIEVTGAAITGPNTITLTYAEPPYSIKYMAGMLPDTSNAVYDNVTYPSTCTGSDLRTGLPLNPTPDSIMVT